MRDQKPAITLAVLDMAGTTVSDDGLVNAYQKYVDDGVTSITGAADAISQLCFPSAQ